jgi:hypothetical protein
VYDIINCWIYQKESKIDLCHNKFNDLTILPMSCVCMYLKSINVINTTNFYIYNMKSESRPVNIDFELWKKAEVLAIDKGITITEFIEEAIREKIDKEKANKIQT